MRPRQAASASRRRSTPLRIRGHPPRRPCRAAAPCGRVKRRTPPRRHDDPHHPHRQRAEARSMGWLAPLDRDGPRHTDPVIDQAALTAAVRSRHPDGVRPHRAGAGSRSTGVAARRRSSVGAPVRGPLRQSGCTALAGMGRRSGRALPPPAPSRPRCSRSPLRRYRVRGVHADRDAARAPRAGPGTLRAPREPFATGSDFRRNRGFLIPSPICYNRSTPLSGVDHHPMEES